MKKKMRIQKDVIDFMKEHSPANTYEIFDYVNSKRTKGGGGTTSMRELANHLRKWCIKVGSDRVHAMTSKYTRSIILWELKHEYR